MTTATNNKSRRMVLPPAIGSYVNVFKARAIEEGQAPKFSISLIWPKADRAKLKPLEDAILAAAIQKFGPTAGKLLQTGKLRNPLNDGDIERPDSAEYKDSIYANANAAEDRQPGIVDARLQPVFEEAECYSGCTFRASVSVYAYDKAGNKGVALGLNNLQVIKKGPRIDGRKAAADEFSEFGEEATDTDGGPDLSDIE